MLGRRAGREEPVVGDVIQGPPSRGGEGGRAGRVVDPEQGVDHCQPSRGSDHRLCQPGIRPRVQLARQPFRRLQQPEPVSRNARQVGAAAQPSAAAREHARPQRGIHGVGGRLDEEHTQRRVGAQQTGDEMLVASPHLVPRLEGQHDQVRHSRLR